MKHQSPPPKTTTSSAEFLTVDQLVARWHSQVASATLATWRSRGNGPRFVKIGGRVLYRTADVIAWETKNTRN
jgi:hypothetical protein